MRRIFGLIGAVVVAIVALVIVLNWNGLAALFAGTSPESTSQTVTSSLYEPADPIGPLAASNQDFKEGRTLQQSGDYDGAIAAYQRALAGPTNASSDSILQSYLAAAYELKGDYKDAILIYKATDSNLQINPFYRAYAVQSMGLMHYDHRTDQSITDLIFSTPPYSSFGPSATTSVEEAYRNLFTYAANLYPLGISETRIARWYMDDLETAQKGSTSTPAALADIAQINQRLTKSNEDLLLLTSASSSDPAVFAEVADILSRKGLIEGYMAHIGIGNLQAAENDFKQAMHYSESSGVSDGNEVSFEYAAFLASYFDKSRESDIHALLAPFSTTTAGSVTPEMVQVLTDLPKETDAGSARKWAELLAMVEPTFKDYLLSLGWRQSDLSSR